MNRTQTRPDAQTIRFVVNGRPCEFSGNPAKRLADVLRDDLRLTGTKIGCNAGDCGACTVLLDGKQVCSCLTAVAQVSGRAVTTVEGLSQAETLSALQRAFHKHGAAQCGICTPGMLIAAADLLAHNQRPNAEQVKHALGGVLCRCTGYQKIVEAVLDAAQAGLAPPPAAGALLAGTAVGARAPKVDGLAKLTGAERYGADAIPADALWLRVVRSPHHHARIELGDLAAFATAHPGIARVLSARDVPSNGFGIYPHIKDQPVLADGIARFRGEAVLALVGTRDAVESVTDAELPLRFTELAPVMGLDAAQAPDAPLVQADKPGNLLLDGWVRKGDAAAAFAACAATAEAVFETGFVEHAYIEPEAGWAERVGERLEIHVTTQTPYMDRDEMAVVMKLAREQIRIVPTACGGGFGGKLDLSVQPLIGVAAWLLGKPVACVYTRPESMAASTKRHPSRIHIKSGCDAKGKLVAIETQADFDTGAYASWGPTVATRVPIHASGPYVVPHVTARGRAFFTHCHPSGAFRGFGVPQSAIAHEAMMDELADKLGMDRLEFRRVNAIRAGDATATGQVLAHSAGLPQCLDALKPHWEQALAACAAYNAGSSVRRRGVGLGCMWYGIGNTSLSNPSTMRIGLSPKGELTLYNGAVDIGQGSNTILTQIAADALGLPMDQFKLVMGDTDLTADAGKTSASRQTFVSGKATELAGQDLRAKLLALLEAAPDAILELEGSVIKARDGNGEHQYDLAWLPARHGGDVLRGEGSFDPPTSPQDADGQGVPYATYAFAAQMAVVEVNCEFGTVKVLEIVAAHDVGKAINPTQVEGQIQGGIMQGLGLALMEEYLPGRTENLHDYLIPTMGDIPDMKCILIEDAEPLGPSGAKGVGEPGLVPTAPAILGAIQHATGVRMHRVPVLPHRLRAAIKQLPSKRDTR